MSLCGMCVKKVCSNFYQSDQSELKKNRSDNFLVHIFVIVTENNFLRSLESPRTFFFNSGYRNSELPENSIFLN